jgi:outer membrane protein assembly factor BamB
MIRIPGALASALVMLTLATAPASAVPCGPTTCAPLSSAVAGSRVLLVRPQGQSGPLVVYDLATGRVKASLPDGILSADGRRFVRTTNGIQSTRVIRFDARTGSRLGSVRLGEWNLKVGAVSSDGRYAALVWGTKDPDISIVDLDRGRLARKVHLDGDWAVDGISRDGRRLYLIEHQSSGSYRVRVHDVERGLIPGAITDPNEPEPMTGIPWSSIGSPDGRWQLTLYLKSGTNKTAPFVHALSLAGATAACIDLPGGDFVSAGRYALVLAPNARTLYAANPSLGVVAAIDLQRKAVTSTVRFAPIAVNSATSAAFGAISPDGRTVYFTGGRGVLAYDTVARAVRAPYEVGAVGGIGVDPSGRTVLVVKGDGSTVRLDAKTGTPVAARS